MRTGHSLKEAATILGIHERRVTQKLEPMGRALALLWCDDPTKVLNWLLDWVERVEQEHFEEHELPRLERMATGRSDREVVHPARSR